MKERDRIDILAEAAGECDVFADVGCDHGYLTERMLKTGACRKAYASDISEKCLKKAEILLADYIKAGKAFTVVSDGLEKLPPCDVAVIAGMGGEEIIGILSRAVNARKKLPQKMVLQPMKNADKVRRFVVKNGYAVTCDRVYYVKDKYYFVIVCTEGHDELTEEEAEFGRTNVKEKPKDFLRFIKEETEKLKESAVKNGVAEDCENPVFKKIARYEKYVKN